jgi:putative MATE family efflux protein
MKQTYDLTNGKVSSLILKFFFPLLLANLLQQIYNIADTVIVGKGLGDNALAAVGNMSSLSFLIVGFSMGLCNGFSIPIAHSFGSGNYNRLRKIIASSIKLSVVVSVLITVLSIPSLKSIMILMQTSDIILNDSLTYGYIIFAGLITTMSYNLCAGILRALGDSKTPFIAILISTVINIILDITFIFVFKTGIAGAAIATVFSQIVSSIICFIKLRRIEIIHLSKSDFGRDFSLIKELIRHGIPMALMNSITAIGCMVVQYFVNGLGVAYTSAYSACSKYSNLFFTPASTAGYTMSSFTSQNFGAKKFDRIKSGLYVCIAIAFISYIVLGSLMVFFPRQLASLMLNEPETINYAAQFMPISGTMLWSVNFLFVVRSGCQGMGFPLVPMISGIAEMLLRIVTIIVLIPVLGFRATAYAEVAAWIGALALNAVAFFVILHRQTRVSVKYC